MFRNHELDSLRSREQDAFQRKQAAWDRYADARNRCNEAHTAMESAWQERRLAGEDSNREWEALQNAKQEHQEIWDEYGRIRDYNNSRIESLRYEADCEHQEMQNAFDRASSEYEYGDKSMAPVYAQEGRDHKERRDELNSEISKLCSEVKEARQNAERCAPRYSASAFHLAKDAFDRAKAHHKATQEEFSHLKAERDRLKAEFDSAQAEHLRLKGEFQEKLNDIKVMKATSEQQAIDKVNMALVRSNAHYLGTLFGQDAKIVPRGDGKTDIYFGGLNAAGDGTGHGHAVIDEDGNVRYLRDAWTPKGKDSHLIDDNIKDYRKTHNI